MLLQANNGNTPLHNAAKCCHLGHVPPELLTERNLLSADKNEVTPLHLATTLDFWKHIPREILTRHNLLLNNKFGYTILHRITEQDAIGVINCELEIEDFLHKDPKGCTALHNASRHGPKFMPPKLLQKDCLLMPDVGGNTPLHYFAEVDGLSEARETGKLWVVNGTRYLMLKNIDGDTPLHILTRRGCGKDMPKAIGSLDLLSGDKLGNTPLHFLAMHGQLQLVPKEIMTAENLIRQNKERQTPVHFAARAGYIERIPYKLTHLELLMKDNKGETALQVIKARGDIDQILGVELPETCKTLVGNVWWQENVDFIANAKISKNTLNTSIETHDIELF